MPLFTLSAKQRLGSFGPPEHFTPIPTPQIISNSSTNSFDAKNHGILNIELSLPSAISKMTAMEPQTL
jgi:hypothetical protein